MPYIKQEDRNYFKEDIESVATKIQNPGELNYCITKLVNAYIQIKGLKYEHINAVIGAMECAKAELYRRVAATYEDKKISENGDVY